jgi:hypothetical protein
MPEEERRHTSADLGDFEVLDGSDTLDGAPGDDPLDRGVATPERWSSGMRYGTTAEEQQSGESLDQLLAEEEPEPTASLDDGLPEEDDWDENATDDDIDRFAAAEGADDRAGRLVADDQDADDRLYPALSPDLIGRDAGIDGGGASAEEAAVHLMSDDDAERQSG